MNDRIAEIKYHVATGGWLDPTVCNYLIDEIEQLRQAAQANAALLTIAKRYVSDAIDHEYAHSDTTGEYHADVQFAIDVIKAHEPSYCAATTHESNEVKK